MDASNKPETLIEAIRYFADKDVAHDYFVDMRWPSGPVCPYCAGDKIGFIRSRCKFQCKACRKQFSAKVGTIFEDSPLGLDKWLPAMWMISSCKNGISSCELARSLGVTQKTAWFMLHRIRLSMQAKSFDKKLCGIVEVDETYIGGKARNMHVGKREERLKGGRGTASKMAVLGVLERHGEIRTEVVERTNRKTLDPRVRAHVETGAEIHTDALASYTKLADEYTHKVIDHAEAYVKDNVHTNGAENYWSLLKRTLKGTYVAVEPFHLFRYLDEQALRFNTRKVKDYARFEKVVKCAPGRRLTYKKLIGEARPA